MPQTTTIFGVGLWLPFLMILGMVCEIGLTTLRGLPFFPPPWRQSFIRRILAGTGWEYTLWSFNIPMETVPFIDDFCRMFHEISWI
jgi:hypothetical protein